MKKIIEIQEVTDDMDCETCGGSSATGWRVNITWDTSLSFSFEPCAACYDGNDYDFSVAYNELRKVITFLPESTVGYLCAEELAPELGEYKEEEIYGRSGKTYKSFCLLPGCEFAYNEVGLLQYLLDEGAPGVYEVKVLDGEYIGDDYSYSDYDDED